MKQYKNFIASGCSFTAGIIEPQRYHYWDKAAYAWPHHCVTQLGIDYDCFVNFALPGGGNTAAINNVIYYLELNPGLEDVLIGINLTGLARQDTICHVNHPDKNHSDANLDVTQQLNIGWINVHGRHRPIENNNTDEIIIHNCLVIIQGIVYFESKNIDYFFMFMTEQDYIESPKWFRDFVDARKNRWVKFNGTTGMMEFAKQNSLSVSLRDPHPSREGHQVISTWVMEHLKNYE